MAQPLTSPWAQVAPDQSAPPAPVQMTDPSSASVAPSVKLAPQPPTPIEQNISNDQQQLQKVRWEKTHGWGTDPTYDASGTMTDPGNHPGKLGKLAHVFSTLGNIAGDIFAPTVMANIPGTQMNRGLEEHGLAKRLNSEISQQSQEAYQGAETGKTQEETAEMPGKTQSEEGLQGAQSANLESETAERDTNAAMGPTLIMGHAHAVNQAIKAGLDPATVPLVQQYEDAIQRLQPQKTPAEQGVGRTTDITTPQGIRTMGYDPKTGKYDIDNGPTGYRPPVTRVETPTDERGQRNDILKAYQPTLDSAERMNVMTESYEKAIKDHDQQAMLNLLANHLGMTMGLQKGARMTKDIVNEAKQSQPWLAGMESKFDKDGYLSGVTLSPNQMRQMVSLGQERYAEDAKKSRATAQYLGAKDDGPERAPGKATINFYLGQANGDPAKAKQLAAQDGWTQ
jgi:hypothetical protein